MKELTITKQLVINSSESIIAAMQALVDQDKNEQFLIVLDDAGKLIGSLTDGDIRRGLLRGRKINGVVRDFMFANPIVANTDADERECEELLSHVLSITPFLPLVDKAGVPQRVIIKERKKLSNVNALVMAGGFGTRLGSKTKDLPKPLVEVRGKPLLEHVFERLETAGFDEIFVSVHFLAEKVKSFIEKTGREKKVHVIYEDKPLGTAGALSLLPENLSARLFVTNCDIISDLDPIAFCDFHSRTGSDALVAVAQHDVLVPYGVVQHDGNGKYLGIEEKPKITNFVAAGIYCFHPNFYSRLKYGQRQDMPELLNRGFKKGMTVSLFPLHESWSDVGTLEELRRVEENAKL